MHKIYYDPNAYCPKFQLNCLPDLDDEQSTSFRGASDRGFLLWDWKNLSSKAGIA